MSWVLCDACHLLIVFLSGSLQERYRIRLCTAYSPVLKLPHGITLRDIMKTQKVACGADLETRFPKKEN